MKGLEYRTDMTTVLKCYCLHTLWSFVGRFRLECVFKTFIYYYQRLHYKLLDFNYHTICSCVMSIINNSNNYII